MERNELTKDGKGYVLRNPIDRLYIPETVQGIIAARMDRLSEDLKKTMQVASVIGRDFAYKILRSILELGDELRTHLTNLVGLEVLYEKTLYPELEYIFKHALTQEVAYESLLKQRRKELHGRIAQTIEELYAGRLEEHYELITYHYEQSGNAQKAVEYLQLAGEKSAKNLAAQAAYAFFSRALELLKQRDVTVNPEKEIIARNGLASASMEMGDIETAVAEYQRAINISRKTGLVDYEMGNLVELSWATYYQLGTSGDTLGFFDKAIARAKEVGDKAAMSIILGRKGFCLSSLGFRYKGNQLAEEALGIALATRDQKAILHGRGGHAATLRWLGNPLKTVELTEGLIEALKETYLPTILHNIIFLRGTALAECGRIDDAMDLLNYGIDACEKFGGGIAFGRHYNCLGYCYGEIYQSQKAFELNLKSEEIGREQMELSRMGRQFAAEMVAQANVNIMENLYDMGDKDEAWERMKSFQEEAKSDDYIRARDRWEDRMHYLAAQILLDRNKLNEAEGAIELGLKEARKEHKRKREGCFLRLLGEIHAKRQEPESAIDCLNQAVSILAEVSNPRQLWQAHASLATVLSGLNRHNDAISEWQKAAKIVKKTAEGLRDKNLRDSFINAQPVQDILTNANQ
jgi:tetratricopeptide (TPR) repeat protein